MEAVLAVLVLVLLAIPVLLAVALVSVSGLKRRVSGLEADVATLRVELAGMAATPDPVAASSGQARELEPAAGDGLQAASSPASTGMTPPAGANALPPLQVSATQPPPLPPVSGPIPAERREHVAARGDSPPPRPTSPGAFEVAVRAAKRWFTVGNVPVKVGMLVMLVGVASFLKYANDQGWLRLPIELRLAGVALVALGGLVFGWRQRHERPAFALAVQGGAIGVLLLVVFAAFKLYGIIPAAAAFGLSIVLVAGLGVLAVLQDSRTLAVLGILAGFLAPIWLSTGSGNHVALFSYYAVLNAAIFGIAWFKSWRALNLLGFAFTWGIGILWGVLQYSPDKLSSTQPFLLLFFAFYLLIPVLFARRRSPSRRDLVDGCLLFGTPLIAFSLQAALLDGERMPLAFCALGLAVIYAVLAWLLRRRDGYGMLVQSHAVLAVGFATLSVPLALSAHATASIFALEGAALAWLGLRQRRTLPQLAGLGLQLLAAVAFVAGAPLVGDAASRAIANPAFMGALLIALAGFAGAWAYRDAKSSAMALPYYLWALGWWCFTFCNEIVVFVRSDLRIDVLLVFFAVTGWFAAEADRRWPGRALSVTALLAILSGLPLALAQTWSGSQPPLAGMGALAWLAYATLGVRSLVCLRAGDGRIGILAQFSWWMVWPWVLSLSAGWLCRRFDLAMGWWLLAMILPWIALAIASMHAWTWLRAPLGERFDACRTPLQGVVFVLLAAWWWLTQLAAGGAAPLPWLPLFNPLELAQVAVWLLAASWLWSAQAPLWLAANRTLPLSLAGFVFVTAVTLRAVHHWGGVPWNAGLWSSSLAQTSLTVVWSLLGVVGWIVGSRRGHRGLWLAGAMLMAVVLAKLVLVDRQHLGNLLGIGSFIAYGLLCTVVGWSAPAPPRDDDATEQEVAA